MVSPSISTEYHHQDSARHFARDHPENVAHDLANVALLAAELGALKLTKTILSPLLASANNSNKTRIRKNVAHLIYAIALCRQYGSEKAIQYLNTYENEYSSLLIAFFYLLNGKTEHALTHLNQSSDSQDIYLSSLREHIYKDLQHD